MDITISLPDGSQKTLPQGSTALDAAKSIGAGLARAAFAAKINGHLCDITTPLTDGATLAIVTYKDKEGPKILRHTAAHILASAVKRLYPKAILEDGPATDTGFFYDIMLPEAVSPEAFPAIEAEMEKIVAEASPLVRKELSREEALALFDGRGERFKIETIESLGEDDVISIYEMGDFVDLCRGPHLQSTEGVKAIKIMNVAGAYRKGDATREQLVRFHAVAFPDKKLLKEYLTLLEEAKKRDHRRIGQDLDLFSFQDEAPGFPFFHAKGSILYNTLLAFMREELDKRDYTEIRTPMILNKDLWLRSGHWDHYRENMYFTEIDERDFAVKPMNCPGGLLVYKNGMHSYRELPIRAAEFGMVHRHEMSGVLHGLFRVRCFTQDDAHVFCTTDQLQAEVENIIDLVLHVYNTVGFKDVAIELSTRPANSIGSDEIWELATETLKKALEHHEIKYQLNPGDGAFYGPKIDFHVKDCLGRTWQCGTIQADFSMPERFDLTYVGDDGEKHRPVMIHRAIFGSIERFLGILIEHYAGNFPLWLAPVQVRVLSLSSDLLDTAADIAAQLKAAGLRVETDVRDEKIGAKIREAEMMKIPVMLIVGKKEAAEGKVSVRRHGKGDQGALTLAEAIATLKEESASRKQ
ncbi:TPA: threonine--tRNA ligase [Candidatus Sumerlaeota bacterium]|nr:threonine--tRNA ligase [Candidatus Sumerlaeota bacterium]